MRTPSWLAMIVRVESCAEDVLMLNASAEVLHGARRWATDAREFDDDDVVYVGQREPVAVDNQ